MNDAQDIQRQMLNLEVSGFKAGTILIDPPTKFATRSAKGMGRSAEQHYRTMTWKELRALPVANLAADHCVLFLWGAWPHLINNIKIIKKWGFTYKTCAFDWMKANVSTMELFPEIDTKDVEMKMGYWTRSNSEFCLLATRGAPKRLDAGVRMGIIEPARQHSRKPDCVHGRIERLVAGPHLELFGRTERPGWTILGDEVGKFQGAA